MKKRKIKKEEVAEDYCFVCKDGGLLLICEYKHCLKAYHPQCVGKDDTFLETGERWTCSWHSCFICNKSTKFHCFCCPNAVCQRCIKVAEFVQIRGKKGFCNNCLKLALLIEENADVDSDGGKVDFKDRDTCEFLFMEYWEIVKEKERLKLETLQLADNRLKKGEKYHSESDSDCEMDGTIEDGQLQWMEEPKEKYFSMKMTKRKVRSKKKEFIGWGSRPLIGFLNSIGIDTSKQFSQYDVNAIITEYVNKNHLMHPVKKKKILCDERLQSVFGRKSINRNKIYDLLESHFSENMEDSEEDEFKYSSDDMEEDASKACERQRISSSERTYKRKQVLEVPQSSFASVTPRNIKLVYLKRSLVECLLKTPETFEEKVVGSFVRVKCDPNDYFQRSSHQLLQVTGVKKTSGSGTGDADVEIIVQVSDMKKEICIRMLSDDYFPEEECDDLRQRVKDGAMKKPTIVELEKKARILHKDITNHWIDREITMLQNLIERANEKGWRRELAEYIERKRLLQTPSERLRLLQEIPTIIPEEVEPEATPNHCQLDMKGAKDDSPRSILVGALGSASENLAGNITVSTPVVVKTDVAGDGAVYNQKSEDGVGEAGNGKVHVREHIPIPIDIEEESGGEKQLACAVEKQNLLHVDEESSSCLQQQDSPVKIDETEEDRPIDVEQTAEAIGDIDESDGNCSKVKRQRVSAVQVVELSDDDEVPGDDRCVSDATQNQNREDPNMSMWYYVDPFGDVQGPFPMSALKRWSDNNYFASDFKVWKTGQGREEAILLTDAISRIFPIS